jgi:predicted nucleotidyltransferase
MEPTVIFETVHGSHAYGLARAGSDLDLKGIVVGPSAWYTGFLPAPEQVEVSPDHVRFELRKFMRLAAASNPTVVEVLWTDPSLHRIVTPAGERLLAARAAFLSRQVERTFARYAIAQLKRIKTHRGWLLEAPTPPTRAEFGLSDAPALPEGQLGAAQALADGGLLGENAARPGFMELLRREKRYRQARQKYKQYRTWVKTRNPARAALEARFGYDTKHALHLVRLLRMALEITTTGEVRVTRDDREELLAIRDGAWTYDELVERAEALMARVEQAAETSVLPERPDMPALNALCVDIIERVLAGM